MLFFIQMTLHSVAVSRLTALCVTADLLYTIIIHYEDSVCYSLRNDDPQRDTICTSHTLF